MCFSFIMLMGNDTKAPRGAQDPIKIYLINKSSPWLAKSRGDFFEYMVETVSNFLHFNKYPWHMAWRHKLVPVSLAILPSYVQYSRCTFCLFYLCHNLLTMNYEL